VGRAAAPFLSPPAQTRRHPAKWLAQQFCRTYYLVFSFSAEQFFFSLFMFYSISHRAICDTICLLFLSKTIPHFMSPATAGFAATFT
jgi:hypothetical protein